LTKFWPVVILFCACAVNAVPSDAATTLVPSGGDLQAALNAAQSGDTILLQAGATWTGSYKLPVKSGTAMITVRSSAPDSSLPPAGTRITPAYSSQLAKIKAGSRGGIAITTATGASNWRLMFLEFSPESTTTSADLVDFGVALSSQSTLAAVPQHLIMDRCYLHGDPTFGQRRGLALNSGDTQIINSYFSDFKGTLQDTQAIGGWNGPGPFLIENNYLEAAGENIMFGGSDPNIPNLVPSNIIIRRNLISKPLAWMSQSWTVKNLLELKNAANVTIEGNTIENNWAAGQQGYSICLTPRNQNNTAPWSVVKNVTIQNNIIRHVAAAFNIMGYDNLAPSQQTQNINILNNLAYDVSTAYALPNHPANALFAVIGAGPKDITISHNTIDSDGHQTISFYAGTSPTGTAILGFALENNLFRDNLYGIMGDNTAAGTTTLTAYTPGAVVLGNSIGGGNLKTFPVGNDYPTLAQWLADFVSIPSANYQLVAGSASKNGATDGTDIGVNFTALNAALAGSGGTTPPPPPSTSTPFSGTRISLPGTVEAENYDLGGQGVAYFDTTAGNSGGVYRTDDVDIRRTTDSSGSYNLKSVRAGEWLAYSVNVASAATYSVALRVASSGGGGTMHFTVDGANVTGSITLPNTGSWDTWQTVTKTGVSLPAGAHLLKLVIDANGSSGSAADINWIRVSTTSAASTPFSGTPIALPGKIEAENYDKGGEGIAYHDTTSGNNTGLYRSDGVDIQTTTDTGGGYKVKTAVAGEWLNYSVSVPTAGTFTMSARVSSSGAGGTFHIEIDGVNKTGTLTVPNTGAWESWTTVSKSGIALAAGSHVMRVVLDTNGSSTGMTGNFNWFSVQ
jgi:hypothetical protein